MTPKPIPRATNRFRKKVETLKFFRVTHASLKTANSSSARGHMGGGDREYPESRPQTPAMGYGPIYKKKIIQNLGPNPHRATAICKVVLTPPLPTPHHHPPTPITPKRGTQVHSKSKNPLVHHFLSKNHHFTSSRTSNTTAWGMPNNQPPLYHYTTTPKYATRFAPSSNEL